MSFEDAVTADRREEFESAAARYEEILACGERSLPVLLNLAVLYWQVTDPGLLAAKKFAPDFVATASQRFPKLLAEAEYRFPDSAEARFWRMYIAWADLGEPLDADECRQLLREDSATAVPAMHLFAVSQGAEAETKALELLRRCQSEGTTRARYIASVINGVLKRRSRKQ
jgi:hypothetical protein